MLLPTLTGVGNDVPSSYLSQTLDYEAEIGSNKYKTLEEAVLVATTGDTINLLANVKLEEVLEISKAITLDLKRFDIKQTGSSESEVERTNSGEYALAVGFTLPTFSGGDGSTSDLYIITIQKELEALATVVNSNLQNVSGKSYKELSYELGNDIRSNTNWTPIGTSYTFEGTLDRAGFEVKNLTIEATTNGNHGLFGNNKGTIKNLSLSGTISVTNSSWSTYVGGIIGRNGQDNATSLKNSYFSWENEVYPIFCSLISLSTIDFTFSPPSNLIYDGSGKIATFTPTVTPLPTITLYYEGRGSTTYTKSITLPRKLGTIKSQLM